MAQALLPHEVIAFVDGFLTSYFSVVYLIFVLYGMFLAQVHHYATSCEKDTKVLKLTVTAVSVLETIHTVFFVHATYLYNVESFGNPAYFATIPWSAGVSIATGMIITFIVQTFYIRRIHVLSQRNWWLTTPVSILLFLRTPFNFASAGLTYTLDTWEAFRTHRGPMITVSFGLTLSAAVDIVIAALLIFYLFRSRTGFKSTDHLVHTLAAYAVNSGFITMCCSTLSLITFFTMKDSIVFAGLIVMSGKLYANSFLGNLNARARLRKQAVSARFPTAGALNRTAVSTDTSGELALRQRPIQIYQETFQTATADIVLKNTIVRSSIENKTPTM